jgi:hypothetical protein
MNGDKPAFIVTFSKKAVGSVARDEAAQTPERP